MPIKLSPERQAKLDAEIARLTREQEHEFGIEQTLNLGHYYALGICQHKEHTSVRIRRQGVLGSTNLLTWEQLMDVCRHFRSQMLSVAHIKDPSYQPVWMPEPINYSSKNPKSEKLGESMIQLEQTGGPQYSISRISFWVDLGELGMVEISIESDCLPSDWRVRARYTGFSTNDGSPTKYEINQPKAVQGKIFESPGSRGSWRYEAYWPSFEEFCDDAKECGVKEAKHAP